MDAAYNAWADGVLVDFLRSIARPPHVDGVLAHLVAAGETWLARLDGDSPNTVLWPETPFEESVTRLAAIDRRLQEPRDLAAVVPYRTTTGQAFENTVAEILMQALNHATYHRGEIAGLLLGAGIEPPIMDYIAYLRVR